MLEEMGIHTVRDLLEHLPHKYLDASAITPIQQLLPGEFVTIQAKILTLHQHRTRRGQSMLQVQVEDNSGRLTLTFFHQPYVKQMLKEGEWYAFTGKTGEFAGRISLANPKFEPLDKEENIHTGRVLPVYPQHDAITTSWLRKLQFQILKLFGNRLAEEEFLSPEILAREQLLPLVDTWRAVHFPSTMAEADQARNRVAFNELWNIFQALEAEELARQRQRAATSLTTQQVNKFTTEFLKHAPFPPTPTQQRAIEHLSQQLQLPHPIRQVVQGEVGSGKTLVASYALLAIANSGGGALYLAPTTVLAQQHYQTIRAAAEPFGRKVQLWTGQTQKEPGEILVGTHALLSRKALQELEPGIVIVDEEHRFGVSQREAFWQQSETPLPHLISMTATPIPRTLAHVMYGDQSVSFLEPIPGKERNIQTRVMSPAKIEAFLQWVQKQAEQGEQTFLITPLISPSEAEGFEDIYSAEMLYQRVKKALPQLKVELLTGKTPAAEKADILQRMQYQKVDVLVSTPVIEVGIDIPHASTIAIFSAERFGLAQLHQLRGRVGRRGQASWCFLIPTPGQKSDRLQLLEQHDSGAALAELDLRQRGAGDFLGTRQAGWDGLLTTHWLDIELIEQVKRVRSSLSSRQ